MRSSALLSFLAATVAMLAACGSSSSPQARVVTQTASTAAQHGLMLKEVGSFSSPVAVTSAPGDPRRLYVVEQGGQIALVVNGHEQSSPFLDLGGAVASGGEQGLLGLAFPKDYRTSGLFYVYYTMQDNNIRVAQLRRSAGNPNHADAGSARAVLTIDHHAFTNHNGGQLAFGPDGYLYVGVGDGGSAGDPNNNGQNTDALLAKILRIAPKPGGGYTIPSDNPFAGKAGKRGEIWAYGLRNPWRFSFDRLTGALIIGDVGQDEQEEIDYATRGASRGANYGWSVWEGRRREKSGSAPGAVFPQLVLRHSAGYCAIIGGFVVRDRSLPGMYGRYLFGDNCHSPIVATRLSSHGASGLRATGLQVSSTSSFGEDARGQIYIASLSGPVYRLAAR